MDEFLLFQGQNIKGDASHEETFPFMCIPLKEWEKEAARNDSLAINDTSVGYLSTFEQIQIEINKNAAAQPILTNKRYLSEVPRMEGLSLPHNIRQEIWFVPLLFILFVGVGLVIKARLSYIIQAMREIFYPKKRSNVFTDHITDEFGFKIAMTVISFTTITLFCQLTETDVMHMGTYKGISSLFHILLLFIGYVAFKILMMTYICVIFFDQEILRTARHSYATICFALCTALFPFVILGSFLSQHVSEYALWAGCAICGLAVLLYLYKIISIFFNGLTSIFYLILYLCTLEILPTIVLVGGLLN